MKFKAVNFDHSRFVVNETEEIWAQLFKANDVVS